MYTTINKSDFIQRFNDYGRENQFSYEGKIALFEYFEEYEESTGEQIKLDVIAICCEFTEWGSMDEMREQYGEEYETADDIMEVTTFISIDYDFETNEGTFITQNY